MCNRITKPTSIILAVGAALMLAVPARADSTPVTDVIVLPDDGLSTGQKIQTQLLGFVAGALGALKPGRSLIVMNGLTLATIGRIDLGADDQDSTLVRLSKHRGPMGEITKFIKNNGVNTDAEHRSAIRLPQALDAIQTIIEALPDHNVEILVVGSAFYTAEPGFSMMIGKTGRVPNYAHLTANDQTSPYGTANKKAQLAGATVHFCYTEGDGDFASEVHRLKVEESWSLYVKERGGALATFAAALPTCMDRFLRGGTHPARTYQIDAEEANKPLAMVEYVRGVLSSAALEQRLQVLVAPTTPIMHTRAPVTTAKALFAATWAANVDLDVFVRCTGNLPYLNWHDQTSPEGHHVFDWRQSPGTAFEIVEMTRDVDVRQCEFYINFYTSNDPNLSTPPAGKVRIGMNGQVWEAPFSFGPGITFGNQNRGFSENGGMSGDYWIKVDVSKVLMLNEDQATR